MTINLPSRSFRTMTTLLLGLAIVLAGASVHAQGRQEKKDPLLPKEAIELIKVYEVDLEAESPPRVIIPKSELREFIKEHQEDDEELRGKSNQEDFLRADGHEQLAKLFEHRAREYYKHVRVRSQIESLREWGNIHRRYVLGYFQPTFGAGSIPELFIFPQGRESDRIEITNFYILTQAQIDGKPLTDRNVPEDSLLIQWGLPRESAKFPAPEIDGWEARFQDEKDRRFIEKVDWIKSLIAENQGSNYGISYQPPQHKEKRN